MRNVVRRLVVSGAAVIAGCCAAQAQSVAGAYNVIGVNMDGADYRGRARIVITPTNACRITWDVGSVSEGICMRNNHAFTAAYSYKGKVGLVIYQIMNDGSMQGLWTLADTPGVGRETLVPAR